MPGSTKECTDVSPNTPLLVRNVEYNTSMNDKEARIIFVFTRPPVFFCMIMV